MHLSLNTHPNIKVCQEALDADLRGINSVCGKIALEHFGITFNREGKMPVSVRRAISDGLYLEKVYEEFDLVKFLYFQVFPFPNLVAYLQCRKDLKFIHLRRRDIFARYISEVIAARSNTWHVHLESDRKLLDLTPMRLDPERVANALNIEDHHQKLVNRHFTDHLEIFYEDLVENWPTEIEKVQLFLGLEPMELKMQVKKSIEVDSRSLVLNLQELASHPLLATHSETILYGKPNSQMRVL